MLPLALESLLRGSNGAQCGIGFFVWAASAEGISMHIKQSQILGIGALILLLASAMVVVIVTG
jgi:hypothetical protein